MTQRACLYSGGRATDVPHLAWWQPEHPSDLRGRHDSPLSRRSRRIPAALCELRLADRKTARMAASARLSWIPFVLGLRDAGFADWEAAGASRLHLGPGGGLSWRGSGLMRYVGGRCVAGARVGNQSTRGRDTAGPQHVLGPTGRASAVRQHAAVLLPSLTLLGTGRASP